MVGLPFDTWVVRKVLDTDPAFYAFWGQMPITREFRFFVRDGEIVHWQPYWPLGAFMDDQRFKDDPTTAEAMTQKLEAMSRITDVEYTFLSGMTKRVNVVVPGYWSVDWLQLRNGGWVLTDMASGGVSYSYEHAY